MAGACLPAWEGKLAGYLSRYNRFLCKAAQHNIKLPAGRKEHRCYIL